MRRWPSAGEQPDPGEGLEEGCVQKDPSCKGWPPVHMSSNSVWPPVHCLPTQCSTVGRVRPGWEYLQHGNLSFHFFLQDLPINIHHHTTSRRVVIAFKIS